MPLPVSPKPSIPQIGAVPWCVPPASYSVPVSAWPIWSLPGSDGARPVALEAAGVAVDDARVDRPRLLVADLQPLGHARAHVVVEDVGGGDQPVGDLQPAGVLEVEGEGELAVAGADVDGVGEVEVERRHLDHGGTVVGEDLRAVGTGDGQPEVEDDDALERRGRQRVPAARRRVARRPRRQHVGGRDRARGGGGGSAGWRCRRTRRCGRPGGSRPCSGSSSSTITPSRSSGSSSRPSSADRIGWAARPAAQKISIHSSRPARRHRPLRSRGGRAPGSGRSSS